MQRICNSDIQRFRCNVFNGRVDTRHHLHQQVLGFTTQLIVAAVGSVIVNYFGV